jgi:hypothetical protein
MKTTTSCGGGSEEPATARDSDEPARPHVVARAQRMRDVHVRNSDRDTCGLCLSSWPCPPRTWADEALTIARLGSF